MKKLTLLTTSLSMFVGTIFSGQIQTEKYWKFGLKGGLNQSNIRALDNMGDKSGYIGTELYGGFVSEYHFDDSNAIQGSTIVSYTQAVTIIEIPIYYKYKLKKDFSIFAGPKLNYIPDPQGNSFYFFPNRLGISADIGVDYQILNNFFVEGSFSKGFTEQINQNALEYYNGKRDVLRLGLVYFLK
ncbi:PorT family protein [Frigoriflavimonas asaccharolytica]|uniref:Outer membrane protein with beta-barrel domain n=1 Tax=Frigoriflavimonas asaccharolytica TaxID=2735899 RepID=A0A8J8G845_9FLAO|nr:PorT family protein [Frigoriflavimonas asaccharolytica]NRS93069.1 hypothetical protein [Frigoriflavimonas asaccharolytica]